MDQVTDEPLDEQERSRIASFAIDYMMAEIERFMRGGNQEFLEVMRCALRHSHARDLRMLDALIKQEQLERPRSNQ